MGSSNTKQENVLINSKTLNRIYAENKSKIENDKKKKKDFVMNKVKEKIIKKLYNIDIKKLLIDSATSGKNECIIFPIKCDEWTNDNTRECFFADESDIDSIEEKEILEFYSNVLKSEFENYKMFIRNKRYIDIELTFVLGTFEPNVRISSCYKATW